MAGINSNTKLMLHCEGADASTTFTDSSPDALTITPSNCEIDTAAYKFDTSSALFNGSTSYLSVPASTNWDLCSQTNVIVEGWVKHTDHVGAETYFCRYVDSNNFWKFWHSHAAGVSFYARSTAGVIVSLASTGTGAGEIEDTNFHHVLLAKIGTEYGVYLDGQQYAHGSNADTITLTGEMHIGNNDNNQDYFDGHMDEMRIHFSNYFGLAPVAGLTDSFTPPTAPYSLSTFVPQVMII